MVTPQSMGKDLRRCVLWASTEGVVPQMAKGGFGDDDDCAVACSNLSARWVHKGNTASCAPIPFGIACTKSCVDTTEDDHDRFVAKVQALVKHRIEVHDSSCSFCAPLYCEPHIRYCYCPMH